MLSGFVGTWSADFFGGPRVRQLERAWAEYFGATHAVSMNSATSGLYAALAAAGVGPGDEVIVSPYTMSASAVAPLLYGATPVFADIDPKSYCISPETIGRVLSPLTKAIVVVDIFGHPADFDGIVALATERGITVIEDAAQAPGAKYKGRSAGRLGHIGVFSLNRHKTIQVGEGGIVVTDDDRLAERLQLVRNHAEVVVKDKGVTDLRNMIGFNWRLPELEAAIATEQLKKLEALTGPRIENAELLSERWRKIPGITPPWVQAECRHVYYLFAMQYDARVMGVSRSRFVDAVRAEGVPLSEGYQEPLYLEPIYQQRAFHCGPNCSKYAGTVSYDGGICPTAELMYRERVITTTLFHSQMTKADIEDVAFAVEKVATEIRQLS
jgi:dTDP-4-amino-4,6-dideoxygalactose transaminase